MLDKVKLMLNFTDSNPPTEDEIMRDEKLELIINMTQSRLKNLLGGVDNVPKALEYIVFEVSQKRFNRIGSEAATSHSVEGESWAFSDNDFDEFRGDISAWRDAQPSDEVTKGKLRFL